MHGTYRAMLVGLGIIILIIVIFGIIRLASDSDMEADKSKEKGYSFSREAKDRTLFYNSRGELVEMVIHASLPHPTESTFDEITRFLEKYNLYPELIAKYIEYLNRVDDKPSYVLPYVEEWYENARSGNMRHLTKAALEHYKPNTLGYPTFDSVRGYQYYGDMPYNEKLFEGVEIATCGKIKHSVTLYRMIREDGGAITPLCKSTDILICGDDPDPKVLDKVEKWTKQGFIIDIKSIAEFIALAQEVQKNQF